MLVPYSSMATAPTELRQLLLAHRSAQIASPSSRVHRTSPGRMWLAVFASIATNGAAVSASGPSSHDCWVSM
jgi:hypothetical protein